jgi:hypothetical protein
MTNRKIIVTPWVVKIWLYASGERTWLCGFASCVRTSRASIPPAPKKASVVKK